MHLVCILRNPDHHLEHRVKVSVVNRLQISLILTQCGRPTPSASSCDRIEDNSASVKCAMALGPCEIVLASSTKLPITLDDCQITHLISCLPKTFVF